MGRRHVGPRGRVHRREQTRGLPVFAMRKSCQRFCILTEITEMPRGGALERRTDELAAGSHRCGCPARWSFEPARKEARLREMAAAEARFFEIGSDIGLGRGQRLRLRRATSHVRHARGRAIETENPLVPPHLAASETRSASRLDRQLTLSFLACTDLRGSRPGGTVLAGDRAAETETRPPPQRSLAAGDANIQWWTSPPTG